MAQGGTDGADGSEAEAVGRVAPEGAEPLAGGVDRATLKGCLGIVCVLALPALLFVPLEALGAPGWLGRLIPLVGAGTLALGAWLLGQVPAGAAARSDDPLRPLTRSGAAPLLERPARRENRVVLAAALGMLAVGVVGYGLVNFDTEQGAALGGLLVTAAAGSALTLVALLAAQRLVATPAWRWVRTPVGGGAPRQAWPLGLLGLVGVIWALVTAAEAGYLWAPIGMGLLILTVALVGIIGRRIPGRGRRRRMRRS